MKYSIQTQDVKSLPSILESNLHTDSIKLNSPVSKTHILRNANQMMKNAATIPINTPKVRIPRLRTVAPSLLFPASKIGNGQNTMDDVEPLFAVRGYLIH